MKSKKHWVVVFNSLVALATLIQIGITGKTTVFQTVLWVTGSLAWSLAASRKR